jgi:hypothetical protein
LVKGAVDVRGIKEGDAGVEGMVDESNHVFFKLRRAIDAGHAHATEARPVETPPVPEKLALSSPLFRPPFLFYNFSGNSS